ncbi:GNAT family N-acetyltransferase [Tenacibaculum sp. HL-MS23]|uniref:GNAT family N-acetyltransferase n=1 Tax=Tenacibaculum sp. HL-MS23 TaxID=3077734 RepID=UPI0028FC193D|nr:GNAT family N-acetyltransferase [Tenacibaculum sp. HL-MS23]WNW00999.1 GNAT family N-acetyltransferase [Tenacibaculum sp. HL-MS23]
MVFSSCNKHTLKFTYFNTVSEISNDVWQQLNCTHNLYFHPQYLEALQQNNPKIQFSYIVLFNEKDEAVALATIQIVDFYLDSVQNEMQSVVEWVKCLGRKLRVITPEKVFKVLTCGNTFVSGEHGIFISKNQNKKLILARIAKAVVDLSNSINDVDAFMLKDFENESLFITNKLYEEGYNSFNVEPNMVLHLESDWYSLDDYLAALKTKFRVKARKALKLSAVLQVENITASRLKDLLPEMTVLYKTVSAKSSFNLGDFNLQTYKSLKDNLGDAYFLKAYWLEDKLVGFLSGIFNQESLDAHFVGIDYVHNRDYAIYQRMLYDYIALGIQKKVKTINFGRTASEIKSSVGAIPESLTIYLRHKKTIPNRILSLFLKRIQPSEFKQKHPFKNKKLIA